MRTRKNESDLSPSPRKVRVRVRNEDSKNESDLSPYLHQRHMYDTSLESSRPPDGRGVIEICIPSLATPPAAKTLFYSNINGVLSLLDIQRCIIPHWRPFVFLMGVAEVKFVSHPLPRPLKLKCCFYCYITCIIIIVVPH